MNRVAYFKARKLQAELRRDVVGGAEHLDFVADHVEHAARSEARAVVFAFERDRHIGGDFSLGVEAQKIDMHRRIRNRVELNVTRQDPVFGSINLDIDQLNEKLRIGNFADKEPALQRQRNRIFLVAVNYGGYLPIAASLACGPLTCCLSRRGGYCFNLGHELLLWIKVPASRGAGHSKTPPNPAGSEFLTASACVVKPKHHPSR